ncbi:MAG: glycoside hydrolase, partial [Odoribacter sp.]|nr:glycoside hydrolase [Odoribacter sp.]
RHEVTAQTASLTSVRSNATDIILRRSSDNGRTWGEWIVLKGGDGEVYLRPEVVNAGDKLYLFYTVDVNGKQDGDYRIEYLESENGGASWTQGEGTVEASADGYVVSTLSGHGILMSDGKLVLPLQCRFGSRGTVAALYSDDNGATWNMGDMVAGLRNEGAGIVETEGKLVMYISHSSSADSRKMAVSEDGGATWSEPEEATIPTGNAGYQTGGATVAGADGTLYHFTPEGAEKTSLFSGSSLVDDQSLAKSMKRLYLYQPAMSLFGKGLTMAVSHDGGTEWSSKELTGIHSYQEYLFPTGAMDAVISGNMVIVVTEGGVAAPYEGLLIYRESVDE